MTEPLSPQQTSDVLAYLHVTPTEPDLSLLNRLIASYGQAVPWESASRIAKRAVVRDTAACPRWIDEFWRDAISFGTGGTCFESNRAFFALLRSLGYNGYLTLNNMGETIGCHTAIVVQIDLRKWLVDVGYPIYAALPLDPTQPTQRRTPYFTYTVHPTAPDRYLIQNTPHPRPYMFDLLDRPIADQPYCQATTSDYGDGGLFLNRLIIRKIVNGQLWRFDSAEQPYHLETFANSTRIDQPITGDLAATLSRHFGIAQHIVDRALTSLNHESKSA